MEFYLVFVVCQGGAQEDDLSDTRLFNNLEAAMSYYKERGAHWFSCIQIAACEFQNGMLVPIKIVAEKGPSIYFHDLGDLFDTELPRDL